MSGILARRSGDQVDFDLLPFRLVKIHDILGDAGLDLAARRLRMNGVRRAK